MAISDYYLAEKERFLENCIICGRCAQECPILPHTDAGKVTSEEIQQGIFDFLKDGVINEYAYIKAFACMECFKCTQEVCPENLNPLLVNELIKGAYISKGLAQKPYADSGEAGSDHRVLASALVCASDYKRITTASDKQKARIVFFPGCNVYLQPEKILSALDIMDAIGDDYAFLPGLDNCCGDKDLYLGDILNGSKAVDNLMTSLDGYSPDLVVLWCPTCQCRFAGNIAPTTDLPFKIVSFAEYLGTNMEKLELKDRTPLLVTLHEPCKAAYTGVDLQGARSVLRQIPGVTLTEMASHGENTLCCGSGAYCWFGDAGNALRTVRLHEAQDTGADYLVTVCHYCGQAFGAEEVHYDFTLINYVSLVAESMGAGREDKFKKYTLWKDQGQIIADAEDCIRESPFERAHVMNVLQRIFST